MLSIMLLASGLPTTGGSAIPLWLWIFLPAVGLSITAAGLWLAVVTSTAWKERGARGERLDNAIDAVLGCPEDPMRGKPEQKGLVKEIRELRMQVGPPNSKSVMQHIDEIEQQLKERKP